MAFFSKAFDKLKGALKKTAQVLNTDVRTLFVPGRQINEEFLNEVEEKQVWPCLSRIAEAVRVRWGSDDSREFRLRENPG